MTARTFKAICATMFSHGFGMRGQRAWTPIVTIMMIDYGIMRS